jgi:hypothetical protein
MDLMKFCTTQSLKESSKQTVLLNTEMNTGLLKAAYLDGVFKEFGNQVMMAQISIMLTDHINQSVMTSN